MTGNVLNVRCFEAWNLQECGPSKLHAHVDNVYIGLMVGF